MYILYINNILRGKFKMNIIVKHYAEIYTTSLRNDGKIIIEVPSRDISLIKERPDIIGFRFFDQLELEYQGKIFRSEPENYSTNYYFGQKISLDETNSFISKNNFIRRIIFHPDQIANLIHPAGICYPLLENDMIIKDGHIIDIIECEEIEETKILIKS